MELLLRMGALFCLFGAIFPLVHAEIFTALVHMEGLVELEGELASQLRDYIRREKDRLRELEKILEGVESAQSLPREEPREHLYHPTNALSLVQRYQRKWNQWVGELVYQDNSHELMSTISFNKYQFPFYKNYKGAVTAIIRLQDTYRLPTHNLTQPKMAGVQAVKMTARYSTATCGGPIATCAGDLFPLPTSAFTLLPHLVVLMLLLLALCGGGGGGGCM